MTPLQDGSPKPPPKYNPDLESSMMLPSQRASPASSLGSLPVRSSNPSLHKLFESTASISGSRPSSGTITPTTAPVPGSSFSPAPRQNGTGTPLSLPPGVSDEHRTLIQRAFVPHVAVLADAETETMIRGKGIEGGLLQLLRPFGETVPGKITIRDSIGASKSHADFGIRFVNANASLGVPPRTSTEQGASARGSSTSIRPLAVGGDIAQVEELVDRHLQYSEYNAHTIMDDFPGPQDAQPADTSSSPFYTLYLRRLLSGLPLVPHETFAHPVASIIVVSSRNPNPTEEFRTLYAKQREGELRLPQWVENDYLRYYVLIHEEETGDIAKSNQTFDQMKRHFGLNCHLLRLKSQQCIASDDDSVPLPTCEWMSASEELAQIQQREAAEDITDPTPYIPGSDVSAIRTFVRELVAQSIVPQMERHVATWNEQVLARRRGLSGRFMSLSKRWTPFGSSRNSSPAMGSSNSNYDSLQGFYRPDAPEALMRKLADYSFMLRDFKLALSTYDILRTDFNNDKAWRHYAAAAEMAALSALMSTGPLSSKTRTENIDSWIEAASYSYTDRSRSAAPYYALRTLTLSLELLRLRGSSAADDAARWASRILDTGLVGAIGTALFAERVAACYSARPGIGPFHLGSRRRKAALWSVLAAESFLGLGKARQAEKCLDSALRLYHAKRESELESGETRPFPQMQAFIDDLRQQIIALQLEMKGFDNEGTETADVEQSLVVEETENLDMSPRAHRKSLIGGAAAPPPLSPALDRGEQKEKDDLFE